MASKIKFDKGDVDDFYEPSGSEDEYTEREKTLLKKVRKNKKQEDSEDEVLAFDDDEEDSDFDDGKFDADSDLDGADDYDGIPDARAWGKKRKDYYSTDFVDQDYSSYNEKEEQMAEQEETEARAIQQRLAKQLNEGDFSLNVFATGNKATVKEDVEQNTHLKTDLSDLSQRQKMQLFKKDSPEFEGLVQDFEQRLEESEQILEPILEYFQSKNISNLPILDFVKTKNQLILTYCSNVAFYLVLKAKRVQIKNHPLVKRLVQMRELMLQLEDKYQTVIKPQLEKFLEDLAEGHDLVVKTIGETKPVVARPAKKTKKLNLLKAMEVSDVNGSHLEEEGDSMADEEEESEDELEPSAKKLKLDDSDSDNELEAAGGDENDDEELGEDDDDRRQITYQMSKNKGLTPHRKKELRNPRVKHRNKFRKALIRRKGAVRTVRKETTRYGGEVSGIKATTKKGIKIK